MLFWGKKKSPNIPETKSSEAKVYGLHCSSNCILHLLCGSTLEPLTFFTLLTNMPMPSLLPSSAFTLLLQAILLPQLLTVLVPCYCLGQVSWLEKPPPTKRRPTCWIPWPLYFLGGAQHNTFALLCSCIPGPGTYMLLKYTRKVNSWDSTWEKEVPCKQKISKIPIKM